MRFVVDNQLLPRLTSHCTSRPLALTRLGACVRLCIVANLAFLNLGRIP